MNTMFLSASDIGLGDGALYSIVGFIIVLAVLALLVGIFYLSGFIFQTKFLSKDNLFERKNKKASAAKSDGSSEDEDDEETVAAIFAAIAAIYADEHSGDDTVPEFVIRHIKRNK